jgi:hypothetical protein
MAKHVHTAYGYTLSFEKQLNSFKEEVLSNCKKAIGIRMTALIRNFVKYYLIYSPVPMRRKVRSLTAQYNKKRRENYQVEEKYHPLYGYSSFHGKFSKGNYIKNLKITLDDNIVLNIEDLLSERGYDNSTMNDIKNGNYIPRRIVVNNISVKRGQSRTPGKSPFFNYALKVEKHGWKKVKAYSPMRKAMDATKHELSKRFGFTMDDISTYGFKNSFFGTRSR